MSRFDPKEYEDTEESRRMPCFVSSHTSRDLVQVSAFKLRNTPPPQRLSNQSAM